MYTTPGSEIDIAARSRVSRILTPWVLLAVVLTMSGCPGRRLPPRPLPPLDRATALPTPTSTPEGRLPSIEPPRPSESLPPHPPPLLATAARMAERGRQELERGRTERAIEILEQAIQVDPNAPFAYYYLAQAYLRRDRAAEARVFAERAANLSQGFPSGWEGHSRALRGQALEALGDDEGAVAAYRRALDIDPENVPAREGLERLR